MPLAGSRQLIRSLACIVLGVSMASCDLEFDPPPIPFTFKVENTFGQLEQPLLTNNVRHYVGIRIDPATTPMPALVSGIARYRATLNGLSNCLLVKTRNQGDVPAEIQEELEQLDAELRMLLHSSTIAFCNFENSGGEFRTAVEELFRQAFTRDGRSDDPANAANFFLDPSLDPDGLYQQVDIYSNHPADGTSMLGPLVDGVLHLAAYSINSGILLDGLGGGPLPPLPSGADPITQHLFADDDPNARVFFNPLPLLAPYLRDTAPIADAFREQRPFIEAIAVESAQAADFSSFVTTALNDTSPSTTPLAGNVRFKVKLEPFDDTSLSGPTVLPYEVSWTLHEGTTLKASGGGHFNLFNTQLPGAATTDPPIQQGPLIADALYAADSSAALDTYWFYLPIDTADLLPSSPVWANMTSKALQKQIDLSATNSSSERIFESGEYRLEVTVKEPFGRIEESKAVRFNITDNILQPNLTDTTDRYFNHDLTATAGTNWRFNYNVSGVGTFDRVEWRILKKSDTSVIDSGTVMSAAVDNGFDWQPGSLATVPDPDFYELELAVKNGTTVLMGLETFDITIYRMSVTSTRALAVTGRAAPGIQLMVNVDDDNGNQTSDLNEDSADEDDLLPVRLNLEPAIPGEFRIATNIADAASQPIKLWTSNTKSAEESLPAVKSPATLPYDFFVEGIREGAFEFRLTHSVLDGPTLTSDPYVLSIKSIEVLVDSDRTVATTTWVTSNTVKVGHWEHAFTGTPPTTVMANFIDRDADRFKIRLTDSARAGAGTLPLTIATDSDGTNYDDDATALTLTEVGPTPGVFESQTQLLVADDVDDDFTLAGSVVADDTAGDRTHKIALAGEVTAVHSLPNGYHLSHTIAVPIEHTVNLHMVVLKNAGTVLIGENFHDANGNGVHDAGETFLDEDGSGSYTANVTEATARARIANDVSIVKERYAQVGIRISETIEFEQPPASINTGVLTLSPASPDGDAALTASETALFTGGMNSATADDIEIYYVPTYTRSGNRPNASSFPSDWYRNMTTADLNDSIVFPNKALSSTLSHEMYHIISQTTPHSPIRTNLFFSASTATSLTSSGETVSDKRRWTDAQETAMHGSAYAQ